jgi:hypothetical protein
MSEAPIYVFTAGDSVHFGLTVVQDGRNLPPPRDGRHWNYVRQATMADADLRMFTEEPQAARAQLTLRGFYLARKSAAVLSFPKAHRSSA